MNKRIILKNQIFPIRFCNTYHKNWSSRQLKINFLIKILNIIICYKNYWYGEHKDMINLNDVRFSLKY